MPATTGSKAQLTSLSFRRLVEARLRNEETVTVIIAAEPQATGKLIAQLEGLGCGIFHRADRVGWILASVPIEAFEDIAALDGVLRLEIDLVPSRGPVDISKLADLKSQDVTEPIEPETPLAAPHLAIDDVDARRFLEANPTFDGRGVVFALIDPGAVDFLLPELHTATTLAGSPTQKVIDLRTSHMPTVWKESRWVDMSVRVDAPDSTFVHDDVVYFAPYAGSFRLGFFDRRTPHSTLPDPPFQDGPAGDLRANAVLWDDVADAVWVDATETHDFRSQPSLKEFRQARAHSIFGTNEISSGGPRRSVGFAVQVDRDLGCIRIIEGAGPHATGVIGHALGSGFNGGSFDGVSPGAQLVSTETGVSVHEMLVAVADALEDPDVDIVCLEPAISHPEIFGLLLDRLAKSSNKLVFSPAGNSARLDAIAKVSVDGSVISIGGYQSDASYRANIGAEVEQPDTLHYASSYGPGGNGLLQPDVLAPSHLISTTLGWAERDRRPGVYALPHGYMLAGGTSTAGPIAAAAAALLISAAKQSGIKADPDRLRHALLSTARTLPGIKAHQQGRGLIQVDAAWDLLRSLPNDWTPTRIEVVAPVRTADGDRLLPPHQGPGLFEREGWGVGQSGSRLLTIKRTRGSSEPVTYDLDWSGDVGNFRCADQIELPLGATVELEVEITTGDEPDVYSAILHFREPGSLGVAHSVLHTVVASAPLVAATPIEVAWELDRPSTRSLFVDIARSDLSLHVGVDPGLPHTIVGEVTPPSPPLGYDVQRWEALLLAPEGRRVDRTLPRPSPGVTDITLRAIGFMSEPAQVDSAPLRPTPVKLSVSLVGVKATSPIVSLDGTANESSTSFEVEMVNLGAAFEPTLRAGIGPRQSERHSVTGGEAHISERFVPAGATTLIVGIDDDGSAPLSLYLYAPDADLYRGPRTWGGSGRPAFVDDPQAGTWRIVVIADKAEGTVDFVGWNHIVHSAFGSVLLDPSQGVRAHDERWTVSGVIDALAIPIGDQELAGVIEVMGPALPDADDYVGAARAATTPTPRIATIPVAFSFAGMKERHK